MLIITRPILFTFLRIIGLEPSHAFYYVYSGLRFILRLFTKVTTGNDAGKNVTSIITSV